jgi:hypothetical protein
VQKQLEDEDEPRAGEASTSRLLKGGMCTIYQKTIRTPGHLFGQYHGMHHHIPYSCIVAVDDTNRLLLRYKCPISKQANRLLPSPTGQPRFCVQHTRRLQHPSIVHAQAPLLHHTPHQCTAVPAVALVCAERTAGPHTAAGTCSTLRALLVTWQGSLSRYTVRSAGGWRRGRDRRRGRRCCRLLR